MTDYAFISWNYDRARLKAYSASLSSRRGKAGDVTLVKMEIEVVDTFQLGCILDELKQIRRTQEGRKANKKAVPNRPLLLTHGDSK